MLKLFNSLSGKKENFKPTKGNTVSYYTCGPTVYDNAHIGNLRTFIFEDILRRTLILNGYNVNHVMNITDIEDKIITRFIEEKKKKIEEITEPYTKIFLDDLEKLNIKKANKLPLVTEHIKEIISLIEELIKNDIGYVGKDGSVYFDIGKFKNYGELVGLENIEIKVGVRVFSDEYEKTDAQDFVLWKKKKGKEPYWDSPWGEGRPGWHIECSALSMRYLKSPIDIHAGGIDLIFPHHENEIAQSEGVIKERFVNFWVHGEHLLVDGKKMSKSLRNFYALEDVENKGINPLAFRYFTLNAHYRSKLNFTWEGLKACENALLNMYEAIARLEFISDKEKVKTDSKKAKEYEKKFKDSLNDDLNVPKALGIAWQLLNDSALSAKERKKIILEFDKVLGLDVKKNSAKIKQSKKLKELVDNRESARSSKQFIQADSLREEIESLGYTLEDTPYGPFIWQRKI